MKTQKWCVQRNLCLHGKQKQESFKEALVPTGPYAKALRMVLLKREDYWSTHHCALCTRKGLSAMTKQSWGWSGHDAHALVPESALLRVVL